MSKIISFEDMKTRLQTLWIFVMFNYLYCDILSNMDAAVLKELLEGHAGNMQISQGFLLGGAILMEIPIGMVLLSRFLNQRSNRLANIIAGSIMSVVQFSSLFVGSDMTLHYMFYSVIEISCTLFIVWQAWNWKTGTEAAAMNQVSA